MLSLLVATKHDSAQIITIFVCSLLLIVVALVLKLIVYLKSRPQYEVKKALLSATEIRYYQVLMGILGERYLIYPQINLATVIDKKSPKGFRTELFRNADFGVFDYSFKPLLLIEINDNSHFRQDRAERDANVQEICKNANLPLVTFWVKDGIDIDEMKKQLRKYLLV